MTTSKRLMCVLILGLIESGCASNHGQKHETTSIKIPALPSQPEPTQIALSDHAQPFGKPPTKANLAAAFLSLPDALAADMSVAMRKKYIAQYASEWMNRMFDAKHRFAEYYNDNAYNPIRPSCIFYLKIVPSVKYRYVFVVSLLKLYSRAEGPQSGNFFVLAPSEHGWVDITEQVMPTEVQRNWYVQPERRTNRLLAGPPMQRSDGDWGMGARTVDLNWANDHFVAHPAASPKFPLND